MSVLMVMFVLLMVILNKKADLKCVLMEYGDQYVVMDGL